MKQRGRAIGLVLLLVCLGLYLRARSANDGVPRQKNSHLSQRTIVVASTKAADTSWVQDELPSWDHAVYVVDDPSAPLRPRVNVGREANVFLTYIVDHYDALPEVVVFAHEHRDAYHVDKAFDGNPDAIRRLDLDNVRRVGYQSLSCWQPRNCVIGEDSWWNYSDGFLRAWIAAARIDFTHAMQFYATSGHRMGSKRAEEAFPHAWEVAFSSEIPRVVSGPLYAQFAVSREQIRARPKVDYKRIHDWLVTTTLHEQASGRALEHMWHVLFGKDAVYCLRREQCLCDGFGLCDKSDPKVQQAINATQHLDDDGNPLGYAEWKMQRGAEGKDSGLWSFALEQHKLQKQQENRISTLPARS